ncbi:matrixin family metalloprotease [Runella sp.]|uniref:matrixin family metalloprotease n=1 Tax=Runella sp. TaxID=1960881 RepID=UPI002639FEDA|nr:matrixin family metalloprotease [Runella sp.]
MKNFLLFPFLALLACQPEPEKASPLFYITASRNDTPSKLRENCVFRYNLDSPFNRLADQAQQDAIKTAFGLWQSSNPNLRFLRYQGTNVELMIRFVPSATLNNETLKAPIGLVRGEVATLSASKKENTTHVILLSNDYAWDTQSLACVVTHQIGLFLGLNTSWVYE